MALTTYAEIQSAVARWLSRTDLTADIPDFITMMEARINRTLRTPQFEFRATATTTADDNILALPSGYRGMRSMRITSTTPPYPLTYMTPQAMNALYMSTETARPKAFTTEADELRLAPTPDAAYTVEMIYFKGITPLATASTDAEKWLLIQHPDIYVHGPCMEAQIRIQRDERIATFETIFQQRMGEIRMEARRTRHAAGPLIAQVEFTKP